MKYFIIFCAVIFTAWSMPTKSSKPQEPGFRDASVLVGNGTRNIPYGQSGFATLNGGTIGGAGGSVWTVWDAWALQNALSGNDRRIIYVRGHIDLTVLFTGSPGVALRIGNFKTVIGGDANAVIFGGGLRVAENHNVIVQNLKFHNALSYAPGEQPNGWGGIISQVPGAWSTIDALGIEHSSTNVWVDHCEFADDPWIANTVPENSRRHDGLLDIVRGANWISVSNTIFRNHNMVTLVGNDDGNGAQDVGRLKVTFYLNWYLGSVQRNPMVRFGEVHVLNNLYSDVSSYGIGVWTGASIFAERNSFVNTRRSWAFSTTGPPNPAGNLYALNNWFENSAFESGIPSAVRWNPSNYYNYSPMGSNAVRAHVQTYAGTW